MDLSLSASQLEVIDGLIQDLRKNYSVPVVTAFHTESRNLIERMTGASHPQLSVQRILWHLTHRVRTDSSVTAGNFLAHVAELVEETSGAVPSTSSANRAGVDRAMVHIRQLDARSINVLRRYYVNRETPEMICSSLRISTETFNQIRQQARGAFDGVASPGAQPGKSISAVA